MRSLPDPISCHWKHLRGIELDAIYRATCGKDRCPGHLGDLAYRNFSDDENRIQLAALVDQERERIERAVSGYPSHPYSGELGGLLTALAGEEAMMRLQGIEAGDVPDDPLMRDKLLAWGWIMHAEPLVSHPRGADTPFIYYGHSDSGFRISTGGKQGWNGWRVGRRRVLRQSPTWMEHSVGAYYAQGQIVRPTDRVWCRSCGTLNRLDWPESLRDLQAQ
jgi:hypothetical protein